MTLVPRPWGHRLPRNSSLKDAGVKAPLPQIKPMGRFSLSRLFDARVEESWRLPAPKRLVAGFDAD